MKTLMYVEDDKVLCNVFIKTFQELDLKLLIAHDGNEAIDLLSRYQPDVLVTGIHMPEPDGFQLLEYIQKKGWKFPVLVLTTMNDENFEQKARSLGASEYLIKSEVTMNQLRKEVMKYLIMGSKEGDVLTVKIDDIDFPAGLKEAAAGVPEEVFEADHAFPPFSRKGINYEEVIHALDAVLSLLPDDPMLLGKKGNCLEALQRYDEALAVYEQALEQIPAFLPNMYNKVFCLERLWRNDECNAYFDVILKFYPNEVKALANKGKILKRLNRLKEGLEYCEKALTLNAKDFSALVHKSEIEEILSGKRDNMYEDLNK